jgi:hypothetical protein
MAGDDEPIFAGAWNGGDQVDHADRSARRHRVPRLLGERDARRRQLFSDVCA